eukprot:c44787_g1_i1 orf=1-345(-)
MFTSTVRYKVIIDPPSRPCQLRKRLVAKRIQKNMSDQEATCTVSIIVSCIQMAYDDHRGKKLYFMTRRIFMTKLPTAFESTSTAAPIIVSKMTSSAIEIYLMLSPHPKKMISPHL